MLIQSTQPASEAWAIVCVVGHGLHEVPGVSGTQRAVFGLVDDPVNGQFSITRGYGKR